MGAGKEKPLAVSEGSKGASGLVQPGAAPYVRDTPTGGVCAMYAMWANLNSRSIIVGNLSTAGRYLSISRSHGQDERRVQFTGSFS